MKKFLLSAVCIVAIAASGLAGYAHYQKSQIDPAILENIEALSFLEGGGGEYVCENTIKEEKDCKVFYCAICDWVDNSTDAFWSSTKKCTK